MLERAAHDGAHQVAAIFAGGLMVLQRIDGVCGGFRGGAERCIARRLAVECGFCFGNAARRRLSAADTNMSIGDLAVLHRVRDQRCAHGEVAGAAAEFVEAEFGIGRQQGQADFGEQLVFGQRG